MGDVLYDKQAPSQRRLEKMGERSEKWLSALVEVQRAHKGETVPGIVAAVLPIAVERQKQYLDSVEVYAIEGDVQGLAVHDAATIPDLSPTLSHLPRLALTSPSGPAALLREVGLGVDVFTLPFIYSATDTGIALNFSFDTAGSSHSLECTARAPLGIDMWDDIHTTDLSPLGPDCACYSCTHHHRAYLHHLLSAREMLAWVLLQLHNHAVADRFFADIRSSVARGTFQRDMEAFERRYEPELPDVEATQGRAPRARGYQFKSEGRGEGRRNPKAYNTLDDAREKLAEAEPPDPSVNAADLERSGLGRST